MEAKAREDLVGWLETFADCVRRVDYAGARALFAEDAIGFGTHTARMETLDDLVAQQWRHVWPETDGFRFDLSALRHEVASDGCLACAMVPWSSTGYDADGHAFERSGRATIVLVRESGSASWKAVHTHLSLNPAATA